MSVNEKMTAIADAIRAKSGETGLLTLDGMAAAIAGIQAGGTTFKSGTYYFESAQGVNSDGNFVLEHNAGFVPKTFLWLVKESTSLDSSSQNKLIGKYKAGFVLMTNTYAIEFVSIASSETTANNMIYFFKSVTNGLSDREATETTIKPFKPNQYMAGSTIPAGSTILWMAFSEEL